MQSILFPRETALLRKEFRFLTPMSSSSIFLCFLMHFLANHVDLLYTKQLWWAQTMETVKDSQGIWATSQRHTYGADRQMLLI